MAGFPFLSERDDSERFAIVGKGDDGYIAAIGAWLPLDQEDAQQTLKHIRELPEFESAFIVELELPPCA